MQRAEKRDGKPAEPQELMAGCVFEDDFEAAALRAKALLEPRLESAGTDGFAIYRAAEGEDSCAAVMLSAPHVIGVVRDGVEKPSEPFTGMMAQLLSYDLGCPAIVKTSDPTDDPNDDETSAYRAALYGFVPQVGARALLDLHQMRPGRAHDVMIGTGCGGNIFGRADLLECLVGALEDAGFDAVGVDEYFCALGAHRVSSAVARHCAIPCFQVEINSALILEECGQNRCAELMVGIGAAVRRMQQLLGEE